MYFALPELFGLDKRAGLVFALSDEKGISRPIFARYDRRLYRLPDGLFSTTYTLDQSYELFKGGIIVCCDKDLKLFGLNAQGEWVCIIYDNGKPTLSSITYEEYKELTDFKSTSSPNVEL